MKNYIYIFTISIYSMFSQQNTTPNLLSSAGGSLEGWGLTSLKMDFSIGEIVINSCISNDFIITQGFHQQNIYISTLNEDLNIELSIFPNPTNSVINIDMRGIDLFPVRLNILDVTGKQWRATESLFKNTHTISLEGLAEGVYFLILENKNYQNIYKIQKTK